MISCKIGTVDRKIIGFTLGTTDGIKLWIYQKDLSEYLYYQKPFYF